MQFIMSATTAAILGESRVTAVRLEDGSLVPTDLVVMAVGIRPNIELARLPDCAASAVCWSTIPC